MNTSEMEQRMKELLEEQEYTPAEGAWERMHTALHPAPPSRKTLFLLPLPLGKIAAAAALILTTGLGGYLWLGNKTVNPEQPGKVIATEHTAPIKEHITPAPVSEGRTDAATPTAYEREPEHRAGHRQVRQQAALEPDKLPPAQHPATPQPAISDIAKATPAGNNKQEPVPSAALPSLREAELARQQEARRKARDYFRQDAPESGQERKGLNLGFAANIGKPSQGDVQYNVGVVARKDLSARIYAEANVSLASTQVNYSERLSPADPGFGSLGSDLQAESMGGKDIALNYTSNILSVGIAPAIGLKATKNISLSVGGDVYKSLNRDLKLKKEQADGFLNAEAIPGRAVTDWDAGIKAQMDYQLGKRFSVNTQYRQGLTQFIQIDGRTIRNSVFNVGLKYYMGR